MSADLELGCTCGAFRAVARGVSPNAGNHLVCYCDDCQTYLHALGCAERFLDAHGGTEIFQTSPARIELLAGHEHLACLQLRPNGLLRWHAGCCRTPFANTLRTGALPFAGLVLSPAADPAREATLGPIVARILGRFARDRESCGADDRVPLRVVARTARVILAARWRGDARRSPFFAEGVPVVRPEVLRAEALAAAEAARDVGAGLR